MTSLTDSDYGSIDQKRANAGGNQPMKMRKSKKDKKSGAIHHLTQKNSDKKRKKNPAKLNKSSLSSQIETFSVDFISSKPDKNEKIAAENLKKIEIDENVILKTRDLLVDFGGKSGDYDDDDDYLSRALDQLEDFLETSQLEYQAIQNLTDDLTKEIDKLTIGLIELDDIFVSSK